MTTALVRCVWPVGMRLGYRASAGVHAYLKGACIPVPAAYPVRWCAASKASHQEPQAVQRENVLTVPNVLCLTRIAASPCLAVLICEHGNFPLALSLFCCAGITDLLDGWISRTWRSQASMLGSFLDPLADKILMTSLFASLSYVSLIPVSLMALVISRDALLVFAGCYIRYMAVPPPFSLKKYLDISIPTASIQPTLISKVNTAFQLGLVATALTAPILGYAGHPLFYALCGATGLTTLASAISYAFQRDTYRFANRAYDHQSRKKLVAFISFLLFNASFSCYAWTRLGIV